MSESDAVVDPSAAAEGHEEEPQAADAGEDNVAAEEAASSTPEPQQNVAEAPDGEQAGEGDGDEEAQVVESDVADGELEGKGEETGETQQEAPDAGEEEEEQQQRGENDEDEAAAAAAGRDDQMLEEKAPREITPRKEYAPIRRSRKVADGATAATRDPALAIIAGAWTKSALSHSSSDKNSVVGSGVHVAAKKNGSLPQGELHITEMTNDTHGMQKLYTRMLTTKMWW